MLEDIAAIFSLNHFIGNMSSEYIQTISRFR